MYWEDMVVLAGESDLDTALSRLPAGKTEVGLACERPGLSATAMRAGKGQVAIRSLAGLSRFKKLQRLELNYVRLEPSALADLTKLKLGSLHLEWCTVQDWAWLSSLQGLRSLTVTLCKLKKLPPLDGLGELRQACFAGNQLKDLAPLAALINLETLDLSQNQLTNLAPLANLKKLKTLRLGLNNKLTSLAPLEGLPALRALDVDIVRKERNRFGNARAKVRITGQAFSAS